MRNAYGAGFRRHSAEFVLRTCQLVLLLWGAVYGAQFLARAIVKLSTILF